MLELTLDVHGAWGIVVVVTELALLRDAVQGEPLALGQLVRVDGAILEVLSNVPIVIDGLLLVAIVLVLVHLLVLLVPPDTLVGVLVLTVFLYVFQALLFLLHGFIEVFF